jgi:hypothetical protein
MRSDDDRPGVRPVRHPVGSDLDQRYSEMAADEAAEREALEWIEGLIGDVADEPQHDEAGGVPP